MPTATAWPVAALPVGGIEGSYSTSINIEELRALGISEHELCENAGTFTLEFVEGQWASHQDTAPGCSDPLHPDGSGDFTAELNQIHFSDPSSFGCVVSYVYQANLTEDGIVFTLIDDPDCLPRTLIFTLHPWTRN
jgi:hypothetical protein